MKKSFQDFDIPTTTEIKEMNRLRNASFNFKNFEGRDINDVQRQIVHFLDTPIGYVEKSFWFFWKVLDPVYPKMSGIAYEKTPTKQLALLSYTVDEIYSQSI